MCYFFFLLYQEHLCKIDEMKTTKYNSLIRLLHINMYNIYKKGSGCKNSVFYSSKSAKEKSIHASDSPRIQTQFDLKKKFIFTNSVLGSSLTYLKCGFFS